MRDTGKCILSGWRREAYIQNKNLSLPTAEEKSARLPLRFQADKLFGHVPVVFFGTMNEALAGK